MTFLGKSGTFDTAYDLGGGDLGLDVTNIVPGPGSNITGRSTTFELLFDFTATTDAIPQAIPLLEGGGNGIGMSIVLNNDDLHFWAGNNLNFVFTASHGMTAPLNDVQLVATISYDTSGSLDTYEMFINGASLAVDGGASAKL